MSVYEKHRWNVVSQWQHIYRHTLNEFGFVNPALPGVTNAETAINFLIAALYPNAKPSVATVGDLPAVGNTTNDYRIVTDDGDGRFAGYRWEQREGEVSPSWHKVADYDWSTEAIVAHLQDVTLLNYVYQPGKSDLDASGTPIAGLYAGQTIYGGNLANQNLTLRANAGDGVGAHTGFVQVDDNFRPSINNAYDLATLTERFKEGFFSQKITVGTLFLESGLITDSSGQISFDNENLITTGNINGAILTGSTSVVVNTGINSVTLVPGSYADTSGQVNFGAANLLTSGTLGAGVTTLTTGAQTLIFSPLVSGKGQITSSTGTISFDNENLETTGALLVGSITATQLDVDNVRVDGNTVSITQVNGNLFLSANGTGQIIPGSEINTSYLLTSTANIETTQAVKAGNLRLSGNTLESTNTDGDILLNPDGVGVVVLYSKLNPSADASLDIGSTAIRFKDIFMSGSLNNGTNSYLIDDLLAYRNSNFRDTARTLPAQAGDTLFYDSVTGTWLANHPDTEILHSEISGLTTGDAGHTQLVMLAGRAGGQTIQGGTLASQNLVLESTANAAKGLVLTKDNFVPFTNASFAGSWSGIDVGDATHYFKDIYTKGEMRGMRFENFTSVTLPASSAQNVGRVVYATDNKKSYQDNGTSWQVLGLAKYAQDTTWNGTIITLTVSVSTFIENSRNAIWILMDNANNFEIIPVKISFPSVTQVKIDVNIPLPAGAYKLIGIE